MNPDKTEFIWFGSRANVKLLQQIDTSLQIGAARIEPVSSVRNLGVHMDSEVSMRVHVAKVASACFYRLRRLRQLRFFLTKTTMHHIVSAFILSRLDYCNSVLASFPATTLAPLQTVMNAAVRLEAGLGWRDHVTPAMRELHWLPVVYRIKYISCV